MVESINATVPLAEARAKLAAAYDLRFTKAVAKVTERVRQRLGDRVADEDWRALAPLVVQITRLKLEKNAAVLADYHQPPEVFLGVADHAGDDLTILRGAARLKQQVIVVAGVYTLAETVSLLHPRRNVLTPDSRSRCSLAGSMTRADVEAIRSQYPDAVVLAHVNASMPVKAAARAIFTATNAHAVVKATPGDRIIMVPDQYLAQHVARETSKKIVTWAGRSAEFGEVTADEVADLRQAYPEARVLAHPQNPPAVAAAADFTGTPEALADWLKEQKPGEAIVLGDRPLAENLAAAAPGTKVVAANGATTTHRPRVGLEAILWSLHTMTETVSVPADLAEPARAAVQRMLEPGRR